MVVTVAGTLPESIPGAKIHSVEGNTLELYFNNDEVPTPVLISRINEMCQVHDLTVENPDIDEVVSKMYNVEAL